MRFFRACWPKPADPDAPDVRMSLEELQSRYPSVKTPAGMAGEQLRQWYFYWYHGQKRLRASKWPVLLTPIVVALSSLLSKFVYLDFLSNPILFNLWPGNSIFVDSYIEYHYYDVQWQSLGMVITVTSSTSFLWLLFIILRVFEETGSNLGSYFVLSKKNIYLFIGMFIFVGFMWLIPFLSPLDHFKLYEPNWAEPDIFTAIKEVFFISFAYWLTDFFIPVFFALFRSIVRAYRMR